MEGDKKDGERGGRLKEEGRRKGRGRASQGEGEQKGRGKGGHAHTGTLGG